MHVVQPIWVGVLSTQSLGSCLEGETKSSLRFRDFCYDLKLLSLVKQKQKFSDTARFNSICYNTIWFLCNILTGIRSGIQKLTGIWRDVQKLEGIVDIYGFTCLIMSASVCRQRILCRYVSYRLWFQCKHFLTINHRQVVSANTIFCTMISSSIAICIFSS